ncbi:acyltransferase [Streptomyces sp. ME19-01-6]|uniref:acyltransferase family protein n=1 Tax=Streptomyces sp. ME19-01-6 TaxID=3028686 RepID=UPI0029AB7785|nr:acyltransferase [Streptomyces sp. ME19-01-6]MDX3229218.1 acyltransferase [Streptomyces sp. ME19-01-6]
MSVEPSAGRLPSLTSLRFLLSIPVIWYHMSYVSGIFDGSLHKALGIVAPFGAGAVSGFFVLSGFVLTWAHRPGDRPGGFWRRRWWKIFPNHLLAWTMTLVLFAVAASEIPIPAPPGDGTGAAVASLFLVQDWIPDIDVYSGFNTPAWSISCEVFFYALFPALIVVAHRIPVRRLRSVWTALAVLIVVMPLVSAAIPGPKLYDWLPINERSLWFIYVFPPVRLLEFLLGIATARLIQTGTWPHVRRRYLAVSVFVFFTVLPSLPPQYAMGSAMAPAFAVIIARLALADLQGRSRRLLRPALITLGDSSFALYLTHFPLMMAVVYAIGPDPDLAPWVGFAIVLGLIAVALALSVVIYRYFELPLMRRWSGGRQTLAPPQPAPAPTRASST